jgi:uncharacterized membrane-anchored protein YhcB (DUF1043 family)
MSDQLFYLFSALLLGLVIGALIMYFVAGSSKGSQQTISNLEKELESYKQDVAEHFEQTADLVDDMTKSYKKVFDHLGQSAKKLMTEEQYQKQLELRKGNQVTLGYLSEDVDNKTEVIEKDEILPESDTDEDTSQYINKSETTDLEIENNESEDKLEDSDKDTESKTDYQNDEKSDVDTDDSKNSEEADLEKEVELREKNIYS